jgi:hypothetical protein
MTQTPIKYFKGELLHVLQKGSDSSYIHRVIDIYIILPTFESSFLLLKKLNAYFISKS